MAKDLYQSLDLNLLKIFHVLMQERNSRKTAERLHVTPPAISQSLTKLRNHFNEPLFVKVSSGLMPTPFAEELHLTIKSTLDNLDLALNSISEFTPSTITKPITISLAPVLYTSIGKRLFEEIHRLAPNTDFEFQNWTSDTLGNIAEGKTTIGYNFDTSSLSISNNITKQKKCEAKSCITVRKNHPLLDCVLTTEEISKFSLATSTNPIWGKNQEYLNANLIASGIFSKNIFRSDDPEILVHAVQNSDLIMLSNNLFPISAFPDLRNIEVDFEHLRISRNLVNYPIYMYVHSGMESLPLIRWLDSLVQQLLQEVSLSNTYHLDKNS